MTEKLKSFNEHQLDEAARRSLSRVASYVHNNAVGIITGHRAEYANVPDEQGRHNKQRNSDLAHDIRGAGFGFIHVRGRYTENKGTPKEINTDEHSFMITAKPEHANKLKKFLTQHGEKYGQDSVLFKHPSQSHATLIGTKEGAFPGKGIEHDLGEFHPNRAPEFHSILTRGGPTPPPTGKPVGAIANKRTFAFEGIWEDFGFYNPISFSSRKESRF